MFRFRGRPNINIGHDNVIFGKITVIFTEANGAESLGHKNVKFFKLGNEKYPYQISTS